MPKQPRFNLESLRRKLWSGFDDRQMAGDNVPRLQQFIHFWVLVWKSFVRNRCLIRASALSYTSLLALIPMLAVAISVTSSLLKTQGEQQIDLFIERMVSNMTPPALLNTNDPPAATSTIIPDDDSGPAAINAPSSEINSGSDTNLAGLADLTREAKVVAARKEIARRINGFIKNTRSGTLGITGMVFLIFVAISMLSRIEETFNDIWGVARGRNWFVRIIQYWTTITLGPLLLACALGLASGPYFQTTKDFIREVPFVSRIFPLLPLVVLWFTFALLYQLVPNTKVRFGAALVGGVVAGSLWHVNNLFGFLYVSRVVTNSKIYGSLGLVPVFMAGLYFSWLILLFGAQVAYAYQNRAAYLQEKLAENVNQRGREFVALRLMTCIGQQFQSGNHPVSVREMSAELGIPTRLIEQVLHVLVSVKLVVEVAGTEMAYAPARPLETINCHHILLAMRAGQGQELATRDEPARVEVLGEFARIQEAERQAASSVTMLALVNRAQSRLPLPAAARDTGLQPAPVELVSEPAPEPEAARVETAAAVVSDFSPVSNSPAPAGDQAVQSTTPTGFTPEEERDLPL